jgi:hypothetical protein
MMLLNYSLLKWKRTSRNTEIAIFQDNDLGQIIFKRSLLINQSEMGMQLNAYDTMREVTLRMHNVLSPIAYRNLSKDNIIALQYMSGPSYHEAWEGKNYKDVDIVVDIDKMFSLLASFHSESVKHTKQEPFAFCDFGPKNLIRLSDCLVALIDPPNKFLPKKPIYDFGILVFEIERSLIQTSRFFLVPKVRKAAKFWIESSGERCIYSDFHAGYNTHIINIIKRYFFFFKKRRPGIELIRGVTLIPLISVFMIFMNFYELYLNLKLGSHEEK